MINCYHFYPACLSHPPRTPVLFTNLGKNPWAKHTSRRGWVCPFRKPVTLDMVFELLSSPLPKCINFGSAIRKIWYMTARGGFLKIVKRGGTCLSAAANPTCAAASPTMPLFRACNCEHQAPAVPKPTPGRKQGNGLEQGGIPSLKS